MDLERSTNCKLTCTHLRPTNKTAIKTSGNTTWIKYEVQRILASHFVWFRSFRKWQSIPRMETKTTIHKILEREGWYRWSFLTPHVCYWMWRLRSQRERGEEKGYSTVKWWISPVPSSFHPNMGFLLTLLRNKDIKAKIGGKSDESFKNIFITTVLKWTSIQFAFWQRFCTFLTQRENHMRIDVLVLLTNPQM